MNKKTFSIEDRLPLAHLKRARQPNKKRFAVAPDLPEKSSAPIETGKEMIANLLVSGKNESDFERLMIKRGARKFAEWIEENTRSGK